MLPFLQIVAKKGLGVLCRSNIWKFLQAGSTFWRRIWPSSWSLRWKCNSNFETQLVERKQFIDLPVCVLSCLMDVLLKDSSCCSMYLSPQLHVLWFSIHNLQGGSLSLTDASWIVVLNSLNSTRYPSNLGPVRTSHLLGINGGMVSSVTNSICLQLQKYGH